MDMKGLPFLPGGVKQPNVECKEKDGPEAVWRFALTNNYSAVCEWTGVDTNPLRVLIPEYEP